MMNKGLRNYLKQKKYRQRMRKYFEGREDWKPDRPWYALKSHGKPCSCPFCSPPDRKYKRKKFNQNKEEK